FVDDLDDGRRARPLEPESEGGGAGLVRQRGIVALRFDGDDLARGSHLENALHRARLSAQQGASRIARALDSFDVRLCVRGVRSQEDGRETATRVTQGAEPSIRGALHDAPLGPRRDDTPKPRRAGKPFALPGGSRLRRRTGEGRMAGAYGGQPQPKDART